MFLPILGLLKLILKTKRLIIIILQKPTFLLNLVNMVIKLFVNHIWLMLKTTKTKVGHLLLQPPKLKMFNSLVVMVLPDSPTILIIICILLLVKCQTHFHYQTIFRIKTLYLPTCTEFSIHFWVLLAHSLLLYQNI